MTRFIRGPCGMKSFQRRCCWRPACGREGERLRPALRIEEMSSQESCFYPFGLLAIPFHVDVLIGIDCESMAWPELSNQTPRVDHYGKTECRMQLRNWCGTGSVGEQTSHRMTGIAQRE